MLERYDTLLRNYRSAWRFRRSAVAAAWTIALLGWLVVCLIPSRYESRARVYVDTNTLLRPLLEGMTVSQNTGSQVDLVRRALLSRPQLERIIDSTDLLKKRIRSDRGRESAITDLGLSIQIRADQPGASTRDPSTFVISYIDLDPGVAYSVVDGVLQSFVTQSRGEARTDVDVAQQFLRSQIADYDKRLTEAEARLAEFKEKNIGAMPDDRGGYFQRLQAELQNLDQAKASLSVAMSKRDELREKLLGGSTPNSAPGIATTETSLDGRIREEQAKLADLQMRFTDEHPDVIAARENIARLEELRNVEREELRGNAAALGAPRTGTSLVAQNLQIALNQADLEVTSLQSEVAAQTKRVAQLRQQVDTMPKVEAELAQLNRDYDVTKVEYDRLLQRLESAKLSDAADQVDDVKFRVLDPPVKALIPAKPNRGLLLAAVLVAALTGGTGLAWARAQLHPVFVDPKEFARFPGVPVFGVISAAVRESAAAERREWRAVVSSAAIIAAVTASLIVAYPHLETSLRAMHASYIGSHLG
jgi:polysaccharide chain length determinant protein (PEP-CTERM system associated)